MKKLLLASFILLGVSGVASAQAGKKAKAPAKAATSQEAPSDRPNIKNEGALSADKNAKNAVDPTAEKPRKSTPAKTKG